MSLSGFFHSPPANPLTVSELNSQIQLVLEGNFPKVYVTGEISNLSRPGSGHVYFSLKDDSSEIRCNLWKSQAHRIRFELENGLKVICYGSVKLYLKGGIYNINIQHIDPLGIGDLQLAFLQLQERLEKEGLFRPDRKKPIPKSPQRIAVITSPTGAALRDFLNTMRRLTRRVDVLICPVLVQGDEASTQIAEVFTALNGLQSRLKIDVIALIRGGGSLEDLWAFNEERTVRAVADSHIPVITGVGHEFDVSISDMAADLRALTPTDAAVRLFPDDTLISAQLSEYKIRLDNYINRKIGDLKAGMERIAKSVVFQSPADRLLGTKRISLDHIEDRLYRKADDLLVRAENILATASAKLEALSPLAVLSRGYSITLDEAGRSVLDASSLSPGQILCTRVCRGEVKCSVLDTIPADKDATA